jgi:iron only hydrogenase large subunit-like protein
MITTCCPGWIKFGEQFFYEELHHMSSCKSPQAMLSSLVKNIWAPKQNIDPINVFMVDIMPCTAKKFECHRPEFTGDTNVVLTTVELARLISLMNIDFINLPDSDFDAPMGISTGAGAIFGHTGGVMEAALRTAADWIENKDLQTIEYTQIRSMETKKEATLTLAGKEIKICVVHTLGEARKLMEDIRNKKSPYHFIEIMACFGGCIGGGGQPAYPTKEVLGKRVEALFKVDSSLPFRKSHKNPAVLEFYKENVGEFGNEKAHKLLHTHYVDRSKEYI